MKSPFPGMDPYIEACGLWPDFHAHLIEKIFEVLADAVPERYLVRTGERSYVVLVGQEGKEDYPFLPDVRVTSPAGSLGQGAPEAGVSVEETTGAPEVIPIRPFIEVEFRETFVEIYDPLAEQQLVTSVEVLSPSNKARGSEGRELYLRKRQGLPMGAANLVEIDLLRGGERMPMLDPWPDSPYAVLVARRKRVPHCLAYPVHSLKPLPTIGIPLTKPDPDVPLALQPLIDTVYRRSRYHRTINYARPVSPPLAGAEATWIEQQLRDKAGQDPK
ncbi:unnamed protein product [uncultured bacterium]|nr:unnamed protein product [uncultured bacterium]